MAGHAALSAKSDIAERLRLALLVHGVDIAGKPGGSVSAAHADQDLAETADALREAVRMLRREADIKAA